MGTEYLRSFLSLNYPAPYGNFLMFDNMEGVIKWDGYGTGSDFAVDKGQNLVFNDDYSLDMITRATSPAADDYVAAYRNFPPIFEQGFKVTLLVAFSDVTHIASFTIELNLDNTTDWLKSAIKYDNSDNKFYYLNSSNSYVAISADTHIFFDNNWAKIEFAVNFISPKYLTFKINDEEYDLSANAVYEAATRAYSNAEIGLVTVVSSDQRPRTYIDDVLITQV